MPDARANTRCAERAALHGADVYECGSISAWTRSGSSSNRTISLHTNSSDNLVGWGARREIQRAHSGSGAFQQHYLKQLQLAPVPGPHCQQITGVVWAESWRRDIHKGIFHDSLFPIWAVWTDKVSFPKPVSFASWPVDRSHRLSNLLLAIHPLAQFLTSVRMNNTDLIFITVAVRHMSSSLAAFWRKNGGYPRRIPQLFQVAILLGTVESRGPAHQDR